MIYQKYVEICRQINARIVDETLLLEIPTSSENTFPKYHVRAFSWDVATVPNDRFDPSEGVYSSTEEKDLEKKISVYHQTRESYLQGEIPNWFGPHDDRIALMCKWNNP